MEEQISKKMSTEVQYREVVDNARQLFEKKTSDYGTSWRMLRLPSLTDQIFIKANRIRTIQETGENKVGEDIEDEFIGILNYSFIALIQCELDEAHPTDLGLAEAMTLYDKVASETFELMQKKNHDYGEAWRDMRISSLVDLILVKLLRIKQIEDNEGRTIVSEGVDANYRDMANYAIFALILMGENSVKEGE